MAGAGTRLPGLGYATQQHHQHPGLFYLHETLNDLIFAPLLFYYTFIILFFNIDRKSTRLNSSHT